MIFKQFRRKVEGEEIEPIIKAISKNPRKIISMKSPEQMGEAPEQSEEKKEESGIEKPEKYENPGWEKFKQWGAASAMLEGKKLGVPQEELDNFTREVIARETEKGDYDFIYRFRKNLTIGTEEEIRFTGQQAYQFLFEGEKFASAMDVAEEIYGKESEEWENASQANEAKIEKEEKERMEKKKTEDPEREIRVSLSKESTFSDLFNAVDAIEEEEGLDKVHFEEELWDNFGPEINDEILSLRENQDKASATKLIDFFKERGYSQKDISIFLPIKFKRERKKE